jgi:DNA replication licensing factor MCM4
MRDMTPTDIEKLVAVEGIVIRVSELVPEMNTSQFKCTECGNIKQVLLERGMIQEPVYCERCKKRHTFDLKHNECVFSDKQLIKIQETPDMIPEGETPQTILVYAHDDLYDTVRPGDRVEVIGIYKAEGVRLRAQIRNIKSVFR